MLYFLIFLVIFTGDQALTWYILSHFELYGTAPLLPGVVELPYVQTTGGGGAGRPHARGRKGPGGRRKGRFHRLHRGRLH